MSTIPAPTQPHAAAGARSSRWLGFAFIVLGIATIGSGVLALVYPGITLLVISLLFGISLLVTSSLDLAEALFDGGDTDTTHRVLGAILAMSGLVLGLIVLRHPFNSLAIIILALGIYLVVAGVVGAVRALRALTADRAARALASIAMLFCGVLILSLPGLSLATLAAFAGIGLMARGVVAIFFGLIALKSAKLGTEPESTPTA